MIKSASAFLILIAMITLTFPGFVSAQQGVMLPVAPVEVIGQIVAISGDGMELKVGNDLYRFRPDALISDEAGKELSRYHVRSGSKVGLVQHGGLISHLIVFEEAVR